MRTATVATRRGAPPTERVSQKTASKPLIKNILHWLDEAKAEKVVDIDIKEKSSLGDYMVIATGRTDRHVGAIAEQLRTHLKDTGHDRVRVEGLSTCDWVVVDAGDIIVHIFRPEVRDFYNLEKMWSAERPAEAQH